MWTRPELKSGAKTALNSTYWKAFLVTILFGIFSISSSDILNLERLRDSFMGIKPPETAWTLRLLPFFLVFSLLVTTVIEVGLDYYFIRNHYGEARVGNLFHGFGPGYLNIVGVQFVTGIIIVLWSLLFVIPGIMASYKYRMVPYLLSENPHMDGKEARQLSAQMTDGQKWDIFVLDLSFLGWYLVGLICFIVGVFLIPPYQYATDAELYITLRDQNGLSFPSDSQGGEPDAPLET